MRSFLMAAGLAGTFLGVPAFAQDAEYDASTVLATVDGEEITLGHVIVLSERLPDQYRNLPEDVLFAGLLDQLIDQTLLAKHQSAGADGDPAPVRLALENERRALLAATEIDARMSDLTFGDDEVQAAYDTTFQPQTEYNASHILVASEDEANALRGQIDDGADFAELAAANSTDGSAAEGGSLGWFGLGRMVPEFEAAVVEMEEGETAGPIQTQFGWHLIRLNETRDSAPPPLEQVRPQIEEQLSQEALRQEIEGLRAEATIERSDADLPPTILQDGGDLLTE